MQDDTDSCMHRISSIRKSYSNGISFTYGKLSVNKKLKLSPLPEPESYITEYPMMHEKQILLKIKFITI